MPKNKKIVFLIIIILLLIIAGGVFWWWQKREIKGSPEDYVIKETEEEKIVENKKAGLTVKVPEGWEVKKMDVEEGSIVLQSLNIEGEKRNGMAVPPLIKGCGIEISVVYGEMSFEEIKEKVKTIHWGLQIRSEEFEEVIINDYQALKNTFDSEVLGPVVTIYIPKENKLYDFSLYFAIDGKEKCIQEFESFLETIQIK